MAETPPPHHAHPAPRPRLSRRALAAAGCALLLPLPALPHAAAAPGAQSAHAERAAGQAGASFEESAAFEEQVLFRADLEEGYACFRIPAVVSTADGTLLAFAEGRRDNCDDAGDIDLVLKRSFDNGRTWGPLQLIAEGGGDTHGNPAPVVDTETGRILLATTRNPGQGSGNCPIPCQRTPYLQHSDDDGATWSQPRDVSEALRPDDWNSWYATGPLHGIQLTEGPHRGRLVVSVNAESYANGRVTHNHGALAHSDDGGDTWRLGAVDTWPIAADGTFRQKPSEMAIAELDGGTIYVNSREQDGTDLGHRNWAVSHDGGDTFAEPFRTQPDLYTPQVQGSLLRLPNDRLLLAAPSDPDRRRSMMVRSSWDGGVTFDSADRGALVTTDWAGYSDMVLMPDGSGTVGLMYEAGPVDARDEIRFARFTEDWLGPRAEAGARTPDLAPGAEPAAVTGDVAATAGRFRGAAAFGTGESEQVGRGDGVRLPFRERLPLGDGDFTVSLWFRYEADGGDHPFVWLGGLGGRSPQVWVRGEPGSGRVRALMTAVEGGSAPRSAEVATRSAFNDGRWHHLALTRGGGRLALSVDGGEAVSVPHVPGSVSRNSTFGVHLGQRPDDRQRMAGALDEVVVYDRALSARELTALRTRNAQPQGRPAVARLPLDETGTGGA
ncbi:sialidase family protein [Streptomyces marincola]|uniref:sialidase family protein n=1 Tax=Streptomyces marincola TaxID=2878388 RepID=UPI001CF30365|nr:sialidase family protein [Streptomyces marincola]UCM89840.1 exo-alpha-sialidase [Streptomyces marincola]